MRLHSIIDDKKKQLVRDAIARGDASIFGGKKKPNPEPPSGIIRGSALEAFIPRANGVSFEEALVRANAAGRIIASNKRIDQAFWVGSEEWKTVQEVFACWSGTMTAYEEAGNPFGRIVEYTDKQSGIRYVFPVPDAYVGVTNGLLVAEHPDFSLETDGNNRIVRAAKVDLIERFPTSEGWYIADQKHGIPFGDAVFETDAAARYLWRIGKRIGSVARGFYFGHVNRRNVFLNGGPSDGLGVAIEAASGDTPQKPGAKP